MILAANRGQAKAYRVACRRMSQKLPLLEQRTAGVYVGYMLRGGVALFLRRVPTASELRVVAEKVYPKVEQEEIFGPIVVVIPFRDDEEAVGIAGLAT